MVLRFNVGGKAVERVDLIKKKKWPWGLYIFPFAILYAIWMFTIVPSIDIVDALIVLGGLVSTHVLAFLFTALFKCFVQYSKANDIYAADSCKVTPAKFSGSKEIVPLHIRQQVYDIWQQHKREHLLHACTSITRPEIIPLDGNSDEAQHDHAIAVLNHDLQFRCILQ